MVHGLCLKLARDEAHHVLCPRDTEGTPLEGFIEFHLKRAASLAAMHVRLVGLETKRVPGATARTVVSVDASFKYVFEHRSLEWHGCLPLIKGHHIFGFVLDLPAWLPPSQDNEHVHIRYEVLATCKEASQSWFREASMQSARLACQVAIHPSTVSTLNLLDERLLPLQPLPGGSHVRASIDSPNARLGGCFWLRLQVRAADRGSEAAAVVRLDRVCVNMRQLWTAPGPNSSHGAGPEMVLYEKQGTELQSAAVVGESGSSTRSLQAPPSALENSSGVSTPKERVGDAEEVHRSSTTLAANIDFPRPAPCYDGTSTPTWQPTTLPETRSSIRFEHQLEVAIEFSVVRPGCEEERCSALLGRSITLVGPDLQSANIELPLYSGLELRTSHRSLHETLSQ